jgi:hypothetical protein
MTGLGLSPNRTLDNVLALCSLTPVPPGKGCFRRCLVAGRHRRARVGRRRPGLREAVVLRRSRPQRLKLHRADAVSGSRGSRPVVQGSYRRPGSARLPGASPGGGVPSVLSGADLGPVLRLAALCPWSGSGSEVNRLERSARKRLRRSGGSPPSQSRSAGPGDQRHRGARRGRLYAGTACLPVFRPASRPGPTAPRAPLFLFERKR